LSLSSSILQKPQNAKAGSRGSRFLREKAAGSSQATMHEWAVQVAQLSANASSSDDELYKLRNFRPFAAVYLH
jgi:hypothetical protein